jgi:hypothetical protein
MGGTLNTQNSKILSTTLSIEYKTAEKVRSYLFYGIDICDICRTKLNKKEIFPNFLYKSLGRCQDSKFCLRDFILLNTIKLFSDHENRSLGHQKQNLEKPLLGSKLWMQDTKLAQYNGSRNILRRNFFRRIILRLKKLSPEAGDSSPEYSSPG